MLERIFDTETIGYVYLYSAGGGMRQESVIATTPENLANYIGSHFFLFLEDRGHGYVRPLDTGYIWWIYQSVSRPEPVQGNQQPLCASSDGRKECEGSFKRGQESGGGILCTGR